MFVSEQNIILSSIWPFLFIGNILIILHHLLKQVISLQIIYAVVEHIWRFGSPGLQCLMKWNIVQFQVFVLPDEPVYKFYLKKTNCNYTFFSYVCYIYTSIKAIFLYVNTEFWKFLQGMNKTNFVDLPVHPTYTAISYNSTYQLLLL